MNDETLRGYDIIGPSMKLSSEFLDAAKNSGRPVLGWVVDDEAGLIKAAKHGMRYVVSNYPLRNMKALGELRRRCRVAREGAVG